MVNVWNYNSLTIGQLTNIATMLAIIIGGIWAFWRFILHGEAKSKIQFDIEFKIIDQIPAQQIMLVDVIGVIENKGRVRHYMRRLHFELLYLESGDIISEGGEKINYQINFFCELINGVAEKKRSWLPAKWGYNYVDPGVIQNFSYITSIPITTKYLLIYAKFRKPIFKYFDFLAGYHTTQKVFLVK